MRVGGEKGEKAIEKRKGRTRDIESLEGISRFELGVWFLVHNGVMPKWIEVKNFRVVL